MAADAKVYKHGDNGARITVYGKKAHLLFAFLLGNVAGKKAKEKHIPLCIINAQKEAQKAFIDAYIAGDAGVTKSRRLMSDLLYLFLQQNIIATTQEREDTKQTVIRGRIIYSKGPRYDLKSPKKEKKYSNRYALPPFTALPQNTINSFYREAISSGYSRATPNRAENNMLWNRLNIASNRLSGKDFRKIFGECTLEYVTEHPNLFQKQKCGREIQISITKEGKMALKGLEQIEKLMHSDLGFARIKKIEMIHSTNDFVYDVSVPEHENFVGGFGGVICHNSGAGLSATVVKDEFLQGWSLEAGALVLANKGLCCTTGDSEFILEDGKRMTFNELFKGTDSKLIKPNFRILSLNNETLKITPFSIKQAIRIDNHKRILIIKTRTGREINLTEDNDVLTVNNSKLQWTTIGHLNKGDFIAVPKRIAVNTTDNFHKDFAYICGLIATDGHISINNKHATTSFYNTNPSLIESFKKKMSDLGFTYSCAKNKAGRESKIAGKKVVSKKDCYIIYNSRKDFAKKIINFGVPSGNKSTVNPLDRKILLYSEQTLCAFMRGIFDGDGSIRHNPTEITITTGLQQNAKLFQEILLQLNILSSVERSIRSWHCAVRGRNNCLKWLDKIGTSHPEKFKRFMTINCAEVKDRIDILPNHQELFKEIIKKNKGKLGKHLFRYFWNYSRRNVAPSKYKLKELNILLNDSSINKHVESDILWDKIISIKEMHVDFVYDFTMEGTNNFVANNIIMHNCIDEMDKMAKEDTWAMHEALEQQSVTISKANIQATLRCETTVLAAANPKFGRFDPYETIANQINLPPTLINRFDLIFPIKDLPEKQKDEKMAQFILRLHQHNTENPDVPTKLLRKYIAYARQRIEPKLTDGAIEELQEYYIKTRSSAAAEGVKAIPISARQLEGLVRLSEASAKLRLSDKVLKKDGKKAIELMDYCLRQVAFDEKTGTIDIDRIATEMPAAQRNKIVTLKEIIVELENKIGKTVPIEDIIRAASEKGMGESDVEELIQKLKKAGDVFEPRHGFISRI